MFLPRPREEVFEFFADAFNLEAITPPWLGFRLLAPGSIVMGAGTPIDYRLRLRGLPVRWRSEITAWEPPQRFVDEQRRGPYRRWVHEHVFEERDGGTEVRDNVDYALFLGRLVGPLFVERDLRKIFVFRQQKLLEHFGRG